MTDNARENGEQETVVQIPEDDNAIWENIRKLEQTSDPADSRREDERADENDNGEDDNSDDGDDADTSTPDTDSPDEGISDTSSSDAQKPDDWEGIPEPVKTRFEALQEKNAALEKRLHAEIGRVAKTQQRIEQLNKIVRSEGRPEGVPDRKALEELKRDYPEVYGAVEPLDKAVQEISAEKRARVEDAKRELEDLYQNNSRQVDEYHPDRHDLLKQHGDAFQHWVMHPNQSVAIREAALSNAKAITDPQAASWVLTQFKSYVGQQQAAQQPPPPAPPTTQQSQPNERRERQRQAASAPRNGGRTPTVSGIPEDGDPEQIWKAFAEQERRERR